MQSEYRILGYAKCETSQPRSKLCNFSIHKSTTSICSRCRWRSLDLVHCMRSPTNQIDMALCRQCWKPLHYSVFTQSLQRGAFLERQEWSYRSDDKWRGWDRGLYQQSGCHEAGQCRCCGVLACWGRGIDDGHPARGHGQVKQSISQCRPCQVPQLYLSICFFICLMSFL